MDEEFCLKWNNHEQNVIAVLEALLKKESLVDVTLVADGRTLPAHKFVLSASSPYFETICSQFSDKHPVIVLKDVAFDDMKALLEFMYKGEVKVPAEQLGSLVKTAMSLKIKGLGEDSDEETSKTQSPQPPPLPVRPKSPAKKVEIQRRSISPPPSKPTKIMKLDNKDSYVENKHSDFVSESSSVHDSYRDTTLVQQRTNRPVSERTNNRDDVQKVEVKSEVVDVSSPDIMEEPMDEFDESGVNEQGGIMHPIPGTSAEEEGEASYTGWSFLPEDQPNDSVSLPETSQGVSSWHCPQFESSRSPKATTTVKTTQAPLAAMMSMVNSYKATNRHNEYTRMMNSLRESYVPAVTSYPNVLPWTKATTIAAVNKNVNAKPSVRPSTQEIQQVLENYFHKNRYASETDRLSLARKLQLTPQSITTWFQNRRLQMYKSQRENTPQIQISDEPKIKQEPET